MEATKVLILGNGLLARHLMQKPITAATTQLSRQYLDPTQKIKSLNLVKQLQPDIIINTIGTSSLSAAAQPRSSALTLNFGAVLNLQDIADACGAAIIHFCTAHVYSGDKGSPYKETDIACPVNVLGDTKLQGSNVLLEAGNNFVLRTSNIWDSRSQRPNIFTNVCESLATGETVVADNKHTTSFTHVATLGNIVQQIVNNYGQRAPRPGLYHVTDLGPATEYAFVKKVAECLSYPSSMVKPGTKSITVQLSPTRSTDVRIAKNNSLCCDKTRRAFGSSLFKWHTNLEAFA